jgi:hypothetical protein
MGHCFIEAIRSVTHLVIAPGSKKAFGFFLPVLHIKSILGLCLS